MFRGADCVSDEIPETISASLRGSATGAAAATSTWRMMLSHMSGQHTEKELEKGMQRAGLLM